ncbi:hypothetical protein, partial [Bradyrhizobium sp.]|uniref:hypothetical protein n=1 Tax=Bradyrhizobium sp. TaxID=376 RepID=UPI003C464532
MAVDPAIWPEIMEEILAYDGDVGRVARINAVGGKADVHPSGVSGDSDPNRTRRVAINSLHLD